MKIEFEDARLLADLADERTLAAQKGTQKIAVEIKVFGSVSSYSELKKAVGQYQIYRTFPKRLEPDREIFLAVSETIYQKVFQRPSVRVIVSELGINLLIFNEEAEAIVQWIN